MSEQKNRIHVVINPAAGKDEPILNTINDVFHQHNIDWGVSVTRKFGDATEYCTKSGRGQVMTSWPAMAATAPSTRSPMASSAQRP